MIRHGILDRIRLEGFLSVREMDLVLRPLNVLIGPNGAGKSNLDRVAFEIKRLLPSFNRVSRLRQSVVMCPHVSRLTHG